jgi:hypothetical protein
MQFQPQDAHDPPNQTLEFFGVDVRLSSIVEFMTARRDNTTVQVMRVVNWYKEQARRELYPTRQAIASLKPDMHEAVLQRAIELVIADSRLGISRP